MCPSHSLVTSGVFKIQNVSSCGLQMSLSYPSLRADGPKCQDPSSAGVHITLGTLALLMGQHLMAKKAALSPLQKHHPSQFWCPNQALWVATLVGTALLHQRDVSGGRERIFHRALVFLRGQEQHRFVCLFAERDLEATAAPVTLTQCQYRAFWDGNPPLQEQQGGERIIHLYPQISFHPQISFPWGKGNSLPQKWGFLKETPLCELRAQGEAPKFSPESPKPAHF